MFFNNFYRCCLPGKKVRFCAPPKFVTVKGLAEPKVAVFVIFAFSGLQRTFLSNFYPCRLWGKYREFLSFPPKFVTVKGLAEPKVTVFAISLFSGPQRTILSNFYPCRLWGK